jgi:hypothetical protein
MSGMQVLTDAEPSTGAMMVTPFTGDTAGHGSSSRKGREEESEDLRGIPPRRA